MSKHVNGLLAAAAPLFLGAAAGMRATVPLAALAVTGRRRRLAGAPLLLLSAGELVYDKLPGAADRTEPPALAARLVSGALAGGVTARRRGKGAAPGAVAGALAALAGAFMFHRLRARASARLPGLPAALGEDLLAVTVAATAVRAAR